MYLARVEFGKKTGWVIRESFPADGGYASRDLFDLGEDPSRFIHYPGGHAYYVDEALEEAVAEAMTHSDLKELDDVFWPFVDPGIRRAVGVFRSRGPSHRKRRPLDADEIAEILASVPAFDKRRVHYFRFGVDYRTAELVPAGALKGVWRKSRDEVEQHFMAAEARLRPSELKSYVYFTFDLQRHFKAFFARQTPQALDPETLDARFVSDLCRLNADASVWGKGAAKKALNPYLVRYAVMFFDREFVAADPMGDYVRDFMRRHRTYRPPAPKPALPPEKAAEVFGLEVDVLKTMSRVAVMRRYRKLAMKHHPDQGGDPRSFIRLTEAYRVLMARIKPKG